MDQQDFQTSLTRDGVAEIATKTTAAGVYNAPHSHPFDVRARVLAGAITLVSEGQERTYRAGDSFAMKSGCEHSERYGAEGATIISGRLHK